MSNHLSPTAHPPRFRLPPDRLGYTHHFDIQDTRGYVTAGMYDDGRLGDLFVYVAKEGSTLSGMIRAWSIAVSMLLQYGVPLDTLAGKFRHMKFDPSGWTKTEDIPMVKSLLDYIFAWLDRCFPEGMATDAVLTRARRVGACGNPQWVREEECSKNTLG